MSGRGEGAVKAGIGLGSAIAVTISWSLQKSIVWAAVHGVLSWIYVIWHALTRQGGISG